MDSNSRIMVIAPSTMIKTAMLGLLNSQGYHNVSLRDHFDSGANPEYVIFFEWVGGIRYNLEHPGELLRDLTRLEMEVIEGARQAGVKKMLFLGRSCIYPENSPQPHSETSLLTGPLEGSTEPSSIATIWGIKACEYYNRQYGTNFIVAIPTGVYGPGDDFTLETAHVLPALIRRFHEAKMASLPAVTLWGSGEPLREWLYVRDMVQCFLFLMQSYEGPEIINIGMGAEVSISELAYITARVVGYQGEIRFDTTKPDGTYRKLLGSDRLSALGWHPTTTLEDGLRETYEWYRREGTVIYGTGSG